MNKRKKGGEGKEGREGRETNLSVGGYVIDISSFVKKDACKGLMSIVASTPQEALYTFH